MTDFEREILQMYDWLKRRAHPKSSLQKNQKAIEEETLMNPDEIELPPVATIAQIYDRVVDNVELVELLVKKGMFEQLPKEEQLKILYEISNGLIPIYNYIPREEE